MAKKKDSKRPKNYEKKVELNEDVSFDDLFNVAIGKKPGKEKEEEKNKKKKK